MENFLDEEFYSIQEAISEKYPKLIIVGDNQVTSIQLRFSHQRGN